MKTKLEIKIIEEDKENIEEVIFNKPIIKNNKEKKFSFFSFFNKLNVNPIEETIASLIKWPIFIGVNAYISNASGLLNYQNQLLLLNNKELPSCLLILFSCYALANVISLTFHAAKSTEKLNANIGSLWFPIKFSLLGSLFVPFVSSSDIQTSGMIEIIKQVVYFAQSLS